jgi:hypothetical protein
MDLSVFSLNIFDANRLAVIVTLILALTAFQYVVSNSIPSIPYMTVADKYILYSFIYSAGLMIYFSLAIALPIDSHTDNNMFWIFFSIWGFQQILIIIVGIKCKVDSLKTLNLSYTELSNAGLLAIESDVISMPPENCKVLFDSVNEKTL